jgi:hypothetical protein
MLTKSDLDKLYEIVGSQIIRLERKLVRCPYNDQHKVRLREQLDVLSALHNKVYEAWKEVAHEI